MNSEQQARVKSLFLAALRIDAQQQASFLARECDDADVRAEVESLLLHHDVHTIVPVANPNGKTTPAHSTARRAWMMGRTFANGISRWTQVLPSSGRFGLAALAVLLVMVVVGGWVYFGVRKTLRELRSEKLHVLLEADVLALQHWVNGKKFAVQTVAAGPQLREAVEQLRRASSDVDRERLRSQLLADLTQTLPPDSQIAIWDRHGEVLAATANQHVGQAVHANYAALLTRVFRRETVLRHPSTAATMVENPLLLPVPQVNFVTPIVDRDGQPLAALEIGNADFSREFYELFRVARMGTTGETYALNRDGVMLSESRFNEQLRRVGLIAPDADSHSATRVQIRDPGGDLTTGFRTRTPVSARSLTKMAAFCTQQMDGIDLDGYRDYRGVPVVGAWRWLPDLDLGVTTEMDVSEASAPIRYLSTAFQVLLGLVTLSFGIVLFATYKLYAARPRLDLLRQVGQYTLIEPIGEGGMGKVYLAKHSLLVRPTAVKLLKPEFSGPEAVSWFHREVQHASQLRHPNTIAIYDFGRTSEGVLYYAMEYLDGLTLSQLIARERNLPPSRVVYIMQQICGSLREAHEQGLVHRDIKPQNIMLCQMGGEYDVVKVLDFGLVTSIHASEDTRRLSALAGTPAYMSPERLRDPQAVLPESDIYSWGAVAFRMLTGSEVYPADSFSELLTQIMHAPPPRPTQLVPSVPAVLDDLIWTCLAKNPTERPRSMDEIIRVLDGITFTPPWDREQASEWWTRWRDAR